MSYTASQRLLFYFLLGHRANVNPDDLDSQSSAPACTPSSHIVSCPGQYSDLPLAYADAPPVLFGAQLLGGYAGTRLTPTSRPLPYFLEICAPCPAPHPGSFLCVSDCGCLRVDVSMNVYVCV